MLQLRAFKRGIAADIPEQLRSRVCGAHPYDSILSVLIV